jgi:DNA repair protein SbcD/Mre11
MRVSCSGRAPDERPCYGYRVRIVHAADLHIDSPLRGLERYEGAPVERLRGATRRALENLVVLCIEERAELLILAGDVFDGAWKDYSTGLFFVGQMGRLREAGIPVVIARGNHDAVSIVAKALRLPDNVRELSSKKAETLEIAGVAVHGQSFHQRVTSDDLAARYPRRVEGVLNIGVVHTSLDGREGHEPYAPTSLEVLASKGYDYWALGHVHAREIVATAPHVVYPGNLQGRHARETGPKGATLITVEDGTIQGIEHRALDVVRWASLTIDAAEASDAPDAVDLVVAALAKLDAEGRTLAARVTLVGRTRANGALRGDPTKLANELRAAVMGDVWLEKIRVATHAKIDLKRIREEASAVGHLARRIEAMKTAPADLETLAEALADLDKRLPAELREEGFTLSDPATLRTLLEDVEELILPRLAEGG